MRSQALQEFETAREELRNRTSEEYNVLKIQLEGQIEELERTIEAAHQVGPDKSLSKSPMLSLCVAFKDTQMQRRNQLYPFLPCQWMCQLEAGIMPTAFV